MLSRIVFKAPHGLHDFYHISGLIKKNTVSLFGVKCAQICNPPIEEMVILLLDEVCLYTKSIELINGSRQRSVTNLCHPPP